MFVIAVMNIPSFFVLKFNESKEGKKFEQTEWE